MIHDVSGLAGLLNLKVLTISGNRLTNIDSLKGLFLTYLDIVYIIITVES